MSSKMVALALALLTPLLTVPQVSVVSNPVIYINVVDKKAGALLETLIPENLRIRIGGTVVPVVNVHKDTGARHIAILLDSSPSMEISQPKWSVGSSLAAAIAAAAPPSTALSFVAFGSKEPKVLQAEKDHHEFVEQITALREQKPDIHPRHTKLWDSVASIIDTPLPLQSGDAIFVVTDGADNASHSHPEELVRRLYGSGIRVFGFALDSGDPKTEEEHAGPEDLREFAKRSGGDCLILQGSSGLGPNSPTNFSMSLQDRQEIQNTIVRFLAEAVRPYRVELAPGAAAISGRLKVEILQRGVERKDVLTLAPDKAFALN